MSSARAGVVAVLVAIVGVTIVACTATPPGTPADAAAETVSPTVERTPRRTPPVVPGPTIAPLPDAVPGTGRVAAVTATSGPAWVGTVETAAGRLWVSVDCVRAGSGPGDLVVVVEPRIRVEFQCAGDTVTRTRDLDQDHPGGPVTIRVETGPEVRWNLLVETSAGPTGD
ncbi:hypothetical protein ACN27F_30880 [Solwaraspora sp. WMMB335]|uniref:hypothetical protein n=1 Tax=Solwaraspora sp. WMMB335 TaxID=3404118 RepID=UPI003B9314FC